jgi:CrcB protein
LIKNWPVLHISSQFYLNTVIINIVGCFILSLFLRLAFDIWELDSDLRLGIATGFIGAFTTFSTLCRETVALLLSGAALYSLMNLIISVTAGITAIYLGDICAKKIMILKELLEDN